jgi:hypothetical protein
MKFRQFFKVAQLLTLANQSKTGRQLIILIARQAGYTQRLNLLLNAFR